MPERGRGAREETEAQNYTTRMWHSICLYAPQAVAGQGWAWQGVGSQVFAGGRQLVAGGGWHAAGIATATLGLQIISFFLSAPSEHFPNVFFAKFPLRSAANLLNHEMFVYVFG